MLGWGEDAQERGEAAPGGGRGGQEGFGLGFVEEGVELGGVAGAFAAEGDDQPGGGGGQAPGRTGAGMTRARGTGAAGAWRIGEGALDAAGEVAEVGPEGDDVTGEGGMMEETGGDQGSQRGEDGGEALEEGCCGHGSNIGFYAPEGKEKKLMRGRAAVG